MYKDGRTETIRPATTEVAAALNIYKQAISNPDDLELKKKFRDSLRVAMVAHNKVFQYK